MRKLALLLALLLIVFREPSAQQPTKYTLVTSSGPIGTLTVTENGRTVDNDYRVDDNGRGSKLREHVELGPDGLPRRWEIEGASWFGAPVKESFSVENGRAKWTSLDDHGDADAKNALSVTVFEEHPPFMSNAGAAKLVPLFRERATKANVPYPYVETQVAGSWAAWQCLEAAVTATKSLDDKVLAQWLKKNRVDTIIGKLRFDGPNNYGDDLFRVKQVQDGKWVVVWPREFAAPGARLLPP